MHIDKFELVWRTIPLTSCSSEDLEGCILPAMKFKPRVLSVNVLKSKVLNFDTDPIFSCESLEDVLLWLDVDDNGYLIIAPTSVHLPFLKKIHLIFVTLGDDFVNKLFMGCPVLEELSLSDCDLKVSKISSSTLKKLFLMNNIHEKSWEIYTPSLVNLEISKYGLLEGISLNKMASLLNARIRSRTLFENNFTNSEPKFLGFLSNVTKLDLARTDAQLKVLFLNISVFKLVIYIHAVSLCRKTFLRLRNIIWGRSWFLGCVKSIALLNSVKHQAIQVFHFIFAHGFFL